MMNEFNDFDGHLTEDELFEKWEGLIKKCLNDRCKGLYSWTPDSEDIYQECAITLLKCIRTYDPNADCTFMHYAIFSINRTISRWFILNKYHTAEHVLKPLSLDVVLEDEKGRDYTNSFLETVGCADETLYLDDWLNSLTDRERTMVELRMAGYTYKEIGEKLGCSKQCVQQALSTDRSGAVRKKYDLYVTKI